MDRRGQGGSGELAEGVHAGTGSKGGKLVSSTRRITDPPFKDGRFSFQPASSRPSFSFLLLSTLCNQATWTHETKGTDLGSQSGRGSDLTTDSSEVDDLVQVNEEGRRKGMTRDVGKGLGPSEG
jgi:hypothetical protein